MAGGFASSLMKVNNALVRKALIFLFPPPPFINCIPKRERKLITDLLFTDQKIRIVDIGGGVSKGPGNWLFENLHHKVVNIDIEHGKNVDIQGSVYELAELTSNVDVIIAQSLIEHLEYPDRAIIQIFDALRMGGHAYIEIPFMQGVHGDPDDFQRYTMSGLEAKFRSHGFKVIKSGISGGPVGSLVWIICDLLSNVSNYRYLNLIIRFILRWFLSPLRYLDKLIYSTNAAKRLACEYYIVVQK